MGLAQAAGAKLFCLNWKKPAKQRILAKHWMQKLKFIDSAGIRARFLIRDLLRELLNVSDLTNRKLAEIRFHILVSKADGQKCERCWHWETDVGSNPEHPTICGRCVEAVKQFQGMREHRYPTGALDVLEQAKA